MIVALNGTSSAGKTTLARVLQERLPGVWFVFGIDTFLSTQPLKWIDTPEGITFHADGSITTGPMFREHYRSFQCGIASMARAGLPIVLDEVLLRGGDEQRVWDELFDGIDVRWVAVRCDVAEERERARGDRHIGLARAQASTVHVGVRYDAEVDTTSMSPEACAESVVAQLQLG